jgi:hypothetical protein
MEPSQAVNVIRYDAITANRSQYIHVYVNHRQTIITAPGRRIDGSRTAM